MSKAERLLMLTKLREVHWKKDKVKSCVSYDMYFMWQFEAPRNEGGTMQALHRRNYDIAKKRSSKSKKNNSSNPFSQIFPVN